MNRPAMRRTRRLLARRLDPEAEDLCVYAHVILRNPDRGSEQWWAVVRALGDQMVGKEHAVTTAKVFVQVEESETPLSISDLAWEHVAPCGCTCGAMTTTTVDHDAAFREFLPNAEMRRRDIADGYVFRLAPLRSVKDRLLKDCSHDPKWGHETVPVPDGYRWAEASGNRLLHLVAVDHSERRCFQVLARHVHARPRDHQSWWREGRTSHAPTCHTCERWARDEAKKEACDE